MSDFVSVVRPILELLYFLSGVLLLVGLWITYNQLVAIKYESRDRADRAAKEKAIEAAGLFVSRAMPASNADHAATEAANIKRKSVEDGDFVFRRPSKQHWIMTDGNVPVISEVVATCNELEAVAAYFTTGVADEQTGFSIIGRSFCDSVEARYEVITFMRFDRVCPVYQSIVTLYKLWKPRIKATETDVKITAMRAEIDRLATASSI